MSDIVNEVWLKQQIKNSIIKEIKSRSVNEISLTGVGAKIAQSGILDKAVPKFAIKLMKEEILTRLFRRFKLEKNNIVGQILTSAINEMSIKDIGRAYEGQMSCKEVTTLLVKIVNNVITRQMIKRLLIYMVQHYDLDEIIDQAIGFDMPLMSVGLGSDGQEEIRRRQSIDLPGSLIDGRAHPKMSENQANNLLNSFVGVVGQQFLEEMAYKFITSKIVPELSKMICDDEEKVDIENIDGVSDKLSGLSSVLDNPNNPKYS